MCELIDETVITKDCVGVTNPEMSVKVTKSDLPFNATDLVLGTFHQNDERYMNSSIGKQCIGNVLAMFLHIYSSSDVSSDSIDLGVREW